MVRTKQSAIKRATPPSQSPPHPSPSPSPPHENPPPKRARTKTKRLIDEENAPKKAKSKATTSEKGKAKGTDKGKGPMMPEAKFHYLDGSFLNFQTKQELNRFKRHFETLKIHPPRYLPNMYCTHKGYAKLQSALHNDHWYDFFGKRLNYISEPLIRAFYSNMEEDEDGDLVTNVNGHQIVINATNIHTMTQLCNKNVANLQELKENFDEVAFLNKINAHERVGRRPTIKGMDADYRLIQYMITKSIKPHLNSLTTLQRMTPS